MLPFLFSQALLPLTSYLLPFTSYLLPLTSYLLPLTSYLLPLTSILQIYQGIIFQILPATGHPIDI